MSYLKVLRKALCLVLAMIVPSYGFPTATFANETVSLNAGEDYVPERSATVVEGGAPASEARDKSTYSGSSVDFMQGVNTPLNKVVTQYSSETADSEVTKSEARYASLEYVAALHASSGAMATLVDGQYSAKGLAATLRDAEGNGFAEEAFVIWAHRRPGVDYVQNAYFSSDPNDRYAGARVLVSDSVKNLFSAEDVFSMATLHSQPSSSEASSDDLAAFAESDLNFIYNKADGRISQYRKDGTFLGYVDFDFVAMVFNSLQDSRSGAIDPTQEKLIRNLVAAAFSEALERTEVLFAEIPVIDGTAPGAAPSTVANLPSAFVYGNYITKHSTDPGVKYVYDVKLASATEAVMKLENLSGTLKIGNKFTFWLRAEQNIDAITYPLIVRARLTDKNGRIVEADLKVMGTKRAFTVDLASVNGSFDINNVQKIELVQSKTISGTNQRANIYLELGGMKDDAPDLNGAPVSDPKPSVQGSPDFSVAGTAITPQNYTGGLSYVYDVRASQFNEAIATVGSANGTFSVTAPFKIRLRAEDAPRAGETIPPLVYPVRSFVKFTDKDGRVVSVNVNLTGNFQDYLIDLLALNAQFDAAHVKKMEIFHDGSFAASGGKNRRAKITADIDGLSKDVAVITGSVITEPQPSTILNQPSITRLGQYSSEQALSEDPANAKKEGFSYQYDLRHNSTDQPVTRLSNPEGLIGTPNSVTLWMRALKAVSGDSPNLTYPSRIMVRFTDFNGKSAVALVDLTQDLRSYTFNLASLNSQLDPSRLKHIEFVQDRSVSNNWRAKVDIKVNGLLKDSTSVNGHAITAPSPSMLGNNPVSSVSGSFISEGSYDGGVSYRYDVRHAPTHEAIMKIEKVNGAMPLTSGNLTLFMRAEAIGAALQPPVKVLLRLTDDGGRLAATTLNLTGTMEQFDINLLSLNPSFNWSAVKKFELIQNNGLSGVNGQAKIYLRVNGLGQKLGYSLNQNIPRNETTLVITDRLTNQVIRQEVYKGLYSTVESLDPSKLFRKIYFKSATEQVIHDIVAGEVIRATVQKDLGNKGILTGTPVNLDGTPKPETRYTLQKDLGDGRTIVSSPVDANGDYTADTRHTVQKDLGGGKTLIGTPVTSAGAATADTKWSVQKDLGGGKTLVGAPVNSDGTANADTKWTIQKDLGDGKTLVGTPVNSDGTTNADTRWSIQKDLGEQGSLVGAPVNSDGTLNADTRWTIQKDIGGGKTLVGTPVNSDGTTNADTRWSIQKDLGDGKTLVGTPVNSDGTTNADTRWTIQKDLGDGKTLVGTPVNSDGTTNADTRWTIQKDLGDGKTLVGTPVDTDGTTNADTKWSIQKDLGGSKTLVGTPVNSDGTTNADTRWTIQQDLGGGKTLVGTPVNSDGSTNADTKWTIQQDLGGGKTLVGTPVNSDGTTNADTRWTIQKDLGDGKTLVGTPVNA
ncbi:MAG: hypothetical protein FGM27_08355, partial [Candidatus Omnitrophica bacterium]|nr:hypothetical protein [Candidatus Omnitrophota bacterium]